MQDENWVKAMQEEIDQLKKMIYGSL